MMTRSFGKRKIAGMTSFILTKTDFPDPEDPRITPEDVYKSRCRSREIILLEI